MTAYATPNVIPHIAAHLREGDRLEIERHYREDPETVLAVSLRDSCMAWTALRQDGLPVAVWGVAKFPQDGRYGVPWMLGTDAIGECRRDFLSFSRHFDRIMSRWFMGLANMVDAEYAGAIRWLEWLGYERGLAVKSNKGFDFIIMQKDTRNVR